MSVASEQCHILIITVKRNINFLKFSYAVSNINFEQSTYSVIEDSGPVQLVLVLTNPSSTDLIIRVEMFDQLTPITGMYNIAIL